MKAGIRYWFGLRAADEVPIWSRVSNSPSVVIPTSTTPGGCVFCPLDTIDIFLGTQGLIGDLIMALVFVAASGGIVLPNAIARRRLAGDRTRPGPQAPTSRSAREQPG